MSRRPNTMALTLSLGLLLMAAIGLAGCGTATLDSTLVREKALAALEKVEAWKVTTAGYNRTSTVDWWSASSLDYRWDEINALGKVSSSATDGKVLIAPGPDGAVVEQPLGAAAGHPANPTEFTMYYWYLKQGRPIKATSSSADPSTIAVTLINAPSSIVALLSTDSYLPTGFQGRSEETRAAGSSDVQASPITMAELQNAVAQVRLTPPAVFPDVTPQDHLVNALRAAGIACYSARTSNGTQGNNLNLMIQVPPKARSPEADAALAQRVLTFARPYKATLYLSAVDVSILSPDNKPPYEKRFPLS